MPSTLACASGTSCLELGTYGDFFQSNAYLIHGAPATWDQAAVTQMTGISPNSLLDGDACPSSTYCVAVGEDGISGEPLVLAGDPSTWGTAGGKTILLGHAFGSGGSLTSVACSSVIEDCAKARADSRSLRTSSIFQLPLAP